MGKTDLIIIGGGAAGLMAGVAAGELGLKALVLERKHKPGRKLLMCGNARCNLTTNISGERMLQMFGEPVGPFVAPAITDASRIMARRNLKDCILRIRLENGETEEVEPLRTRSIKEAMVTVGGVALDEIDNQTMESKKCPGLYFAGEVLDIDGPTGGYNLQAAFSSARLAVASIGKRCGKGGFQSFEKAPKRWKRK